MYTNTPYGTEELACKLPADIPVVAADWLWLTESVSTGPAGMFPVNYCLSPRT